MNRIRNINCRVLFASGNDVDSEIDFAIIQFDLFFSMGGV